MISLAGNALAGYGIGRGPVWPRHLLYLVRISLPRRVMRR